MVIRLAYLLRYGWIFLKALVIANVQVVQRVLGPRLRIRPGFLAVTMNAASDFEITSLANSITLTPGTISVHVEREHRVLVIHVLDVGDDPDAVRRDVRETLEDNLLLWTRAPEAKR